jgi:hypothetical protein
MNESDDNKIILGVPAIRDAMQPRFAKPLSIRQVRHWIDKKILDVGRTGGLHSTTLRRLNQQIRAMAGER